eukprot:COSAG02_NODE_10772_length_1861_cov_3.655505_1_plen_341_part_00
MEAHYEPLMPRISGETGRRFQAMCLRKVSTSVQTTQPTPDYTLLGLPHGRALSLATHVGALTICLSILLITRSWNGGLHHLASPSMSLHKLADTLQGKIDSHLMLPTHTHLVSMWSPLPKHFGFDGTPSSLWTCTHTHLVSVWSPWPKHFASDGTPSSLWTCTWEYRHSNVAETRLPPRLGLLGTTYSGATLARGAYHAGTHYEYLTPVLSVPTDHHFKAVYLWNPTTTQALLQPGVGLLGTPDLDVMWLRNCGTFASLVVHVCSRDAGCVASNDRGLSGTKTSSTQNLLDSRHGDDAIFAAGDVSHMPLDATISAYWYATPRMSGKRRSCTWRDRDGIG